DCRRPFFCAHCTTSINSTHSGGRYRIAACLSHSNNKLRKQASPFAPRKATMRPLLTIRGVVNMANHYGSQATLHVSDREYTIFRIPALAKRFPSVATLPFCLKILLENLLRTEDGVAVRPEDIE